MQSNAFVGFNYQKRKFRAFRAWESQDWIMGGLERRTAKSSVGVTGMVSLEPYTLKDIGSPQVLPDGRDLPRRGSSTSSIRTT